MEAVAFPEATSNPPILPQESGLVLAARRGLLEIKRSLEDLEQRNARESLMERDIEAWTTRFTALVRAIHDGVGFEESHLRHLFLHDVSTEASILRGSFETLLELDEQLDRIVSASKIADAIAISRSILWKMEQAIEALHTWTPGALPLGPHSLKGFLREAELPISTTFIGILTEPSDRECHVTASTEIDVHGLFHQGTVANLLINMARNSRRHGQAQRLEVHGSIFNGRTKIEVLDNGTGFDRGLEAHVFEHGYSGHRSSGLGLAEAPRRLAAWDGTIECQGHGGLVNLQGGQGARFVMSFPLAF